MADQSLTKIIRHMCRHHLIEMYTPVAVLSPCQDIITGLCCSPRTVIFIYGRTCGGGNKTCVLQNCYYIKITIIVKSLLVLE